MELFVAVLPVYKAYNFINLKYYLYMHILKVILNSMQSSYRSTIRNDVHVHCLRINCAKENLDHVAINGACTVSMDIFHAQIQTYIPSIAEMFRHGIKRG